MRKIAFLLILLFVLFNGVSLFLVKDINLYSETDKLLQYEQGTLDYERMVGRLKAVGKGEDR